MSMTSLGQRANVMSIIVTPDIYIPHTFMSSPAKFLATSLDKKWKASPRWYTHMSFINHSTQLSLHMVNSDEKEALDAPGARDWSRGHRILCCDWPDHPVHRHHDQPLHHLRQHDQALLRETQGCQPWEEKVRRLSTLSLSSLVVPSQFLYRHYHFISFTIFSRFK